MRNEFTYMGPYIENIDRRLEPDFRQYDRKDGTKGTIQERPDNVDGLFIGFMEEQPRKFWAVAVHDESTGEFIYPTRPLELAPIYTDGKSFGPHNNTTIESNTAQMLLKELLDRNPKHEALERLKKDFDSRLPK